MRVGCIGPYRAELYERRPMARLLDRLSVILRAGPRSINVSIFRFLEEVS